MSAPRFRYSELFAGVGGFRVALDRLGGACVFACEIEAQARGCYESNFPPRTGCRLDRDVLKVREEDVPAHDLLTGGFPCQPFSREGDQPGLEHRSGGLFREIVRILRAARPPMFLLENVPGLLSAQEGEAMRAVTAAVGETGYDIVWRVIDTAALLPQVRRRVYIAGFRRDCGGVGDFDFPVLPQLKRGVGEVLEDPTAAACSACALAPAQWQKRCSVAPAELFLARPEEPFPTLTRNYRKAPGTGAAKRFAAQGLAGDEQAAAKRGAAQCDGGGEEEGDDTPGRAGWRNLISRAAPGAPPGAADAPTPRFLTPRECARLQGFPESFRLPQGGAPNGPAAALFGNAVSPPVIAAVAEAMIRSWERRRAGDGADGGAAAAKRPRVPGPLAAAFDLLCDAAPAAGRAALSARLAELRDPP